MNNCLVSVVVNCYNGELFLKNAIDSILNQTYTNLEIIFWDNLSTDGSASIINQYCDHRIKYFIADRHTSLGEARFLAMKHVSGRYVAFLDCDDEWLPDKLEYQLQCMRNNDASYSYGGNITVDQSGAFIGKYLPVERTGNLFPHLVRDFNVDMLTPIIEVCVLRDLNINFNPAMEASEEINLFLRLSLKTKGMAINRELGIARRLSNSLTRRTGKYWHKDISLTIDQIYLENPNIKSIFENEFKYLSFKVSYLKAKWLMSIGEYELAKTEIHENEYSSIRIYYFIKMLSNFPAVWLFVHRLADSLFFLRHSVFVRKFVGR